MLIDQITSAKYRGTEIGNAMLGFEAYLFPSGGYSDFFTALTFAIASVFGIADISVNTLKLVGSLPNRDMIWKCVTENVVDTVVLTQDSVQGNCHVYVSSDKGNKKGKKNLAKFIFWLNREKGEIQSSSSMWTAQMRTQVI